VGKASAPSATSAAPPPRPPPSRPHCESRAAHLCTAVGCHRHTQQHSKRREGEIAHVTCAAAHSRCVSRCGRRFVPSVPALTGHGVAQEEAGRARATMDETDQQAAPLSNKSGYYYAHNTVRVLRCRGRAVRANAQRPPGSAAWDLMLVSSGASSLTARRCGQVSPEGPKTLVGATEIYKHKPLGADEIKQMERDNSFSEETGSSAWNKGGTWEEKDFSKWAEARIKEVPHQMLPCAADRVCCRVRCVRAGRAAAPSCSGPFLLSVSARSV